MFTSIIACRHQRWLILFSLGLGAPFHMSQRITQIPLPGSSGVTPTGAMQFEDDWPGLFLRGDTAASVLSCIRSLQERLRDHPDPVVTACLIQLGDIADLIDRDVIVRER
jgi:hypothetical protein